QAEDGIRDRNVTGVQTCALPIYNPKNYNGIKIYDQNGGQLLPDESEDLSQYINAIERPLQIDGGNFNSLLNDKKITYMSHEVTEAYKSEVKDLVEDNPETDAKVVLTSLHGTSLPLTSTILSELDYDNFVIEKEQY